MKSATRSLSVFICCVLLLGGCAAVQALTQNETDVRVIDLNIAGASPIGWLDNDTFVSVMHTSERYVRKDGAEGVVSRIAAINYRTGERTYFGKVTSELCFDDGYVSYVFLDHSTGELWASRGELGKEVTERVERGRMLFDQGPNGSCRPWAERPPPPEWAKGKTEVWHLWPRLGLISCDVSSYSILNRQISASFYGRNNDVAVRLPFSCYDVRQGFKYYAFRGAFFTVKYEPVLPWPVGHDRRAFWLYPDGTVEIVILPYSSAIRGNLVPTVRGIVGFSRPETKDEDYGVYLITPEGAKRILRGHAAGTTSPDGCKVAILHDPSFRRQGKGYSKATLKVLEVCPSDKG